MPVTVIIKFSNTSAAIPTLLPGELAINRADEKLYYTNSLNVLKSLSLLGGVGGGSTPRYAAYATAVGTNANLVAAAGTSYSLPAATLTANRTIDLTNINTEADYVEFDNQETGFTWSFIGASVIDSYGNSVTTLLANARYVLRRSNNQIKIFY